ncbi:Glutamyl-tRNA(Gln) amidotransferase subunit B-like protein [Elsinoe fawcettii]|nr:Glutamyl-tRNA(Gln) amidotransferase subunit B-like protein [Elsinoe fawcettii]
MRRTIIYRPGVLLNSYHPLRQWYSSCTHDHRWVRGLQTASEPLRKQLKDEAKRLKRASKSQPSAFPVQLQSDWELTVGIEIHARLNTPVKLFSPAPLSNTSPPNENVHPFDAALPGTRPQFQPQVLVPAIRAALALNCTIQPSSRWDRKHYFYQDQPAGYQITQYYAPFALSGSLVLKARDLPREDALEVGIKQIQLEQDTAKSVSPPGTEQFLLDLSRVGAPLVEIISLPHIHSPGAAAAYVRKVRDVLRHVDACEGNMERGDLRADVNVSVKRKGSEGMGMGYAGVEGLGTRTEIKNLNSIRAVEEAVRAERDRQIKVLEEGGVVEGETRGWTVGGTETTRLRGKEGEVDYRYMPDPDLGPVWVGEEAVGVVKATMPELMEQTVERVKKDFGMSEKDAWTLFDLDDGERLEFAAEVVDKVASKSDQGDAVDRSKAGKAAANWILHEIGGLLTTKNMSWEEMKVTTEDLAAILQHLLHKQITGRSAKQLLQTCFEGKAGDKSVQTLIEEGNLLLRPMSEDEYRSLAQSILDESPDAVAAVREKGQKGKVMFFVGQMMRRAEEGTVEADTARIVIEQLLRLR